MTRPAGRRPGSKPGEGPRPWRTCLGCRHIRSQVELLRLVRRPDGSIEPDLRRRDGGRGAYVCRRDNCLEEAIRRARWAHAFRAPAALMPETAARLRALIEAATAPSRPGPSCDDGALRPVRAAERSDAPVEGRC